MPGEYKLVVDEVLDPEEAKTRKDSELLKLLFVGITRSKHTLMWMVLLWVIKSHLL